jgi:UDP-N-acetyl-2-amino-2-deoxyglucuronate dehydrogenase
MRLALRLGADVICEKPLVLNPWNLDLLEELEEETKSKIFTVLQLRLHPSIIKLKNEIDNSDPLIKHNVELSYITSRGLWYHYSWKAHPQKSGGIATNIGIHLFDLLIWIFGDVKENHVHLRNSHSMGGFIELERANVKWFLSINNEHLPDDSTSNGQRTFRALIVDGAEVQFSSGFTELHTEVYKETLAGRGFGINSARPSIELVYNVRNSPLSNEYDIVHPQIEKMINEV